MRSMPTAAVQRFFNLLSSAARMAANLLDVGAVDLSERCYRWAERAIEGGLESIALAANEWPAYTPPPRRGAADRNSKPD